MRRRVSRVILKTLLIHDEVSIMLVFHKQLNLTYTHEHDKIAETLKFKKLVGCKCSLLNGTVWIGQWIPDLTATHFLTLTLYCSAIWSSSWSLHPQTICFMVSLFIRNLIFEKSIRIIDRREFNKGPSIMGHPKHIKRNHHHPNIIIF